jgi:signal peptidase II
MTQSAPPPVTQRRSIQAVVACIVGAIALTGLDLWSKTWAESTLSIAREGEAPPICVEENGYIPHQRLRGESIPVIEDIFEFEYAENCGAAFGLMRDQSPMARALVFGVAAIAAVGVLLWLFFQGRGGALFAWSVPLVASGALGNFIDRMRYGYVVDFIHFHYEPWSFDYPTFNVADITIVVGVALLVLDSMFGQDTVRTAKVEVAKEALGLNETPAAEPVASEPVASEAEVSSEPAKSDETT